MKPAEMVFGFIGFLTAEGIRNYVVDSASIEVNRRKRRVKADKLDVNSLVRMLIRYSFGEQKIWSVVRVPSAEDEDRSAIASRAFHPGEREETNEQPNSWIIGNPGDPDQRHIWIYPDERLDATPDVGQADRWHVD